MTRFARLCLALVSALVVVLTGCSTNALLQPPTAGASGAIHGGQQPISGAAIQLYAVGTSGDGSAARPLLVHPVFSDSSGSFNITGAYTCPGASSLVYLVGTGGSPSPGISNPQIALMAALGPCGNLSPATFISVNEITTVAAVYSLASYMTSFAAIGSGSSDASALGSAFANAGYLANTATGSSPGSGLPGGYSVPVAQVDTIADILASCINSPGGVSGDGSACGSLFALTLPYGATAPTNVMGALLNLANNPALNTTALYNLVPPAAPFQPIQPNVPPDLAIHLSVNSAFTVSPGTVNFASITIDFSQPVQTITVSNGTLAGVVISSASISGVNASDFAIVPQPGSDCAIVVPAGASCSYQVSFTPLGAGNRAAYFVLGNNSANPSIAVALAGHGIAGGAGPVTLSPSSLAFSLINVPQSLTLTNSGSSALSIQKILTSSTAFAQTNNCGSSLAADGSCTIAVAVVSTSVSGTLTVVDDAGTGPQTASVTYPGNYAQLPTAINMGGWAVGATSAPNYFEIYGLGVSGTYSLALAGPNLADFTVSTYGNSNDTPGQCYYNFQNQSPCYVIVTFTPSAAGPRSAFLSISSVGNLPLTGNGDAAGADFGFFASANFNNPGLTIPLSALSLGSQPIGSASAASTVIVRNTGTISPLPLSAPVLSGQNAADFSLTSTACANAGCNLGVIFTPSAAGARSATLTWSDAGSAVTRTLLLSGTGTTPAPVLTSDTSLLFSNVPAGTVSAAQTISVTAYHNDPIQASITPTSVGGDAPFIFIGPSFCASTPCQLTIAYAPTANSHPTSNAYIVATDGIGLSTGSIQAVGQIAPLPFISFSPQALTFAAQALHTVSAAQTVTITNSGSEVLTLTATIQLIGNAPDYAVVNHCPASLAINATCTMDVTFIPTTSTGVLHTDLVIGGSNVPRYVDLTGTSF